MLDFLDCEFYYYIKKKPIQRGNILFIKWILGAMDG